MKKPVVTEIIWSGGYIPAGQRDDFVFSAKVPTVATTLRWKAYQTYADGSIVSWDQDAHTTASSTEFSKLGPFSTTEVIDDILISTETGRGSYSISTALSIIALALSVIALTRTRNSAQ